MHEVSTANVLDSVNDVGLAELEVRLQGKLGGRVRQLRLDVLDGGLVLRGYARTYYAKQLAQHTAMTESEMPIHANEIVVF